MRQVMLIDLDRCVGCMACVTSCKERWNTGPGSSRNWVKEYLSHNGRGQDMKLVFYPGLCNQCKDHPCTPDCPTGATYMDKQTGIVMVDSDVCIGCGNCISNCVYDARKIDESKGIVEKCNLCAPYVKQGIQPACVDTCLADCRFFGDIDDPNSKVSKKARSADVGKLVVKGLDYKPGTLYKGIEKRNIILSNKVIKKPQKSLLTNVWSTVTRPFASLFVPIVSAAVLLAGVFLNFKNKNVKDNKTKEKTHNKLDRHVAGIRLLHWFNAASWLFLLASGIALMSAESFAFFGQTFPEAARNLAGGAGALMDFHIILGLAWFLIIIPVFLVYKHGGRSALKEILITKDDINWVKLKPFVMLGFSKKSLPPQDKYNAGQKLFAVMVLLSTTVIIVSGLVMTFHLGSEHAVAAAIVVHKLTVFVTLLGVAVHVMMAAILKDERPALFSMFTGKIDYEHAKSHNAKWVNEITGE